METEYLTFAWIVQAALSILFLACFWYVERLDNPAARRRARERRRMRERRTDCGGIGYRAALSLAVIPGFMAAAVFILYLVIAL